MTTTFILGIVLIISLIINLNLFSINIGLKNKLLKIENLVKDLDKPLRRGYIKKELSTLDGEVKFTSYVFVKEIDRYTNGESKIEIEKIEYGVDKNKANHSSIDSFIRNNIKSIIDPADVIWIESEDTIKEMRKAKLEVLKERIKNYTK